MRDALSLKPNDSVVFVHRNNEIIIKSLHDIFSLRGSIKTNEDESIDTIREQTKKEISRKITDE